MSRSRILFISGLPASHSAPRPAASPATVRSSRTAEPASAAAPAAMTASARLRRDDFVREAIAGLFLQQRPPGRPLEAAAGAAGDRDEQERDHRRRAFRRHIDHGGDDGRLRVFSRVGSTTLPVATQGVAAAKSNTSVILIF